MKDENIQEVNFILSYIVPYGGEYYQPKLMVKGNNKYAFSDGYPFGDYDYIRKYNTVEEAQAEEEKVRNMVRTAVINSIFPQNTISTVKAEEILAQLKIINKLKTKLEITNALNLVIKDLTNYTLKRS